MLKYTRSRIAWALTLLAFCAEVPALAGTFGGLQPVANQQLDQVRGGFSLDFDFGRIAIAMNMNRLNFVNGILTAVDPIKGQAGGTLNLIQTGPSVVVSQPLDGGTPTVSVTPTLAGSASSSAPLISTTPGVAPVPPNAPIVTAGTPASVPVGSVPPSALAGSVPLPPSAALNNVVSSSVANGLPAGTVGTVIQNNLDGQMIQSINVLNITVTSQALAQAVALQSLTQGALLRFMH